MNAGLTETITGIEVVKSAVQEEQERHKFLENAGGCAICMSNRVRSKRATCPSCCLGFALTGAFAHGVWLVSRGELSIGELVAYMGLMGVLRFPAFISIFTFSLVQMGLAGARRILELMKEETELDENKAGHTATIRGEIVFDHVTFRLDNDPEACRC